MHFAVERRINSDLKCGKETIDEILQNIKEIVDPDTFFNTKLILNELMINSVIHGNCGDMNKMIDIKVYIINQKSPLKLRTKVRVSAVILKTTENMTTWNQEEV